MIQKIQVLVKQGFLIATLSGLMVTAGMVSNLSAQSKLPEAVIAVIDVNHILQNSEPSKAAEEKVKALLKTSIDDLNKRGENLKNEKEQLDKQRAILAPDVYQKKLSNLNVERQKLQREFQVINAQMNEVLVGARLKLRSIIIKIAAEVSKEKGVNIGFDQAKVVFYDNKMDITKDVLERFNKAKPTIEITASENPKAATEKKN